MRLSDESELADLQTNVEFGRPGGKHYVRYDYTRITYVST